MGRGSTVAEAEAGDEAPAAGDVLDFDQELVLAPLEPERDDVSIELAIARGPAVFHEGAIVPEFEAVVTAHAEPRVGVGGDLDLGPGITHAVIARGDFVPLQVHITVV